ncbi:MAG: HlyD family efflux transporter periplasmic adaptor subunit [Desulfovibrio sp.]|nr:HlyD family efflux transporter periplasmic adaptor subunit [Desulfovibrio sp.]
MSDTQEHARGKGRAGKLGLVLLLATVGCVGLFVIWGVWRAAFPPLPPFQGQMEGRTISISSKVPGRVQEVLVEAGDNVRAGQVLALMHLPEVVAKLSEARARDRAAEAQQSMVDEGLRPQEKEAARAEWERAQAAADLDRKTYDRIAALFKDGLVSRERFDEARARMLASADQAAASRQVFDLAQAGSRPQQKEAAGAETSEAAAAVSEVASLADNRALTAPRAGQVDKVVLVAGELAGAGFPVLTLVDLEDQWASFNIREESLPGITIGHVMKARVPALGREGIDFKVYYISPRASYATWRSTREDSGYDMKTFEVRARPVEKVEDLRPGMTVLVDRER